LVYQTIYGAAGNAVLPIFIGVMSFFVYGLGPFLCSILQNGHFPGDREWIRMGEMAGYWDYVGTRVEFPYTKSVHGFDEFTRRSTQHHEDAAYIAGQEQ
jgi:hypothetical protein